MGGGAPGGPVCWETKSSNTVPRGGENPIKSPLPMCTQISEPLPPPSLNFTSDRPPVTGPLSRQRDMLVLGSTHPGTDPLPPIGLLSAFSFLVLTPNIHLVTDCCRLG